MDKIIDNIYNMSDRQYDIFKFLVVTLLIAIAVTVYFALRIPGQLAERERIIEEWNSAHAERLFYMDRALDDTQYRPGVIWYDSVK